ncbi:MAG TPA: GNAT family N-acetyltransferase [Chitinophagaceae bacterium]|nr:GNAT family N-acetyltransferase [Chitinophagaceae bacterium]
MKLAIVDYEEKYQPCFEKFNKAWLEEYFTVEPVDKWVLEHPREAILDKGGKIYFAMADGVITGTVALRFIEEGVYEMTKMAVDKNFRGAGIGKLLCKTAIEKAREQGVRRLILYSNSILKDALHIYRKLGFKDIPVQPGMYRRSDVMMEIIFKTP